MKQIIAIIILIGLTDRIYCVKFEDCGTRDATVSSVTVTDCSDSDTVCTIKGGGEIGVGVKFTSNVDSSTNTIKLTGIINGLAVPWTINPSDACKWGLNCPVKSGSSQEFMAKMAVSTSWPKIAVIIRVAVVDASGGNLFCTQFPAHIA